MDKESKILATIGAGVVLPVAVSGAVAGYITYGVGAAIIGAVLAVLLALALSGLAFGAYHHRRALVRNAIFLISYIALVFIITQFWDTKL